MNFNELVGSRCLLKLGERFIAESAVDEYKVLELSPTGQWVKLMNLNGKKFWRAVVSVSYVETLKDLGVEKPGN